ncbi:hypothetical protein [Sphingomonas sp. DT-51]|uniref:hypothetical protein n=1 Tax=Sphingomonas sp. DT-51 TaxID=3396165 RepID=UPI003F53F2C2
MWQIAPTGKPIKALARRRGVVRRLTPRCDARTSAAFRECKRTMVERKFFAGTPVRRLAVLPGACPETGWVPRRRDRIHLRLPQLFQNPVRFRAADKN